MLKDKENDELKQRLFSTEAIKEQLAKTYHQVCETIIKVMCDYL